MGGFNFININFAFVFDFHVRRCSPFQSGGGSNFININCAFVFDFMFDVAPLFNRVGGGGSISLTLIVLSFSISCSTLLSFSIGGAQFH